MEYAIRSLELMFKWGLLLTPEELVFNGEPYTDEPSGQPVRILQRRFCLTELSDTEVTDHAEVFGPIALEFDQQTLRRIGCMPVIYIPQRLSKQPEYDRLALLGQTLVYRLFDTYQLLSDLTQIHEDVVKCDGVNTSVTLGYAGGGSKRDYPVRLLLDLFQSLTVKRQPFSQLAEAMNALSCFFYPTDDASNCRTGRPDDGRLVYYREREWRIISGIHFAGQTTDENLPDDAILQIGSLINGSLSPYESARLSNRDFVESSTLLRTFGGRPIMNSVRRILVPSDLLSKVSNLARQFEYPGVIAEYP